MNFCIDNDNNIFGGDVYMFDYGTIIDLNQVTLADCLMMYEGGKCSIINDGEVINFEEGDDN